MIHKHYKNSMAIIAMVVFIKLSLPYMAFSMENDEDGEKSIFQGIYSEQQVRRGAETFNNICQKCHMPNDFSAIFYPDYDLNNQIVDYYEVISMTMPQDSPGTLSKQVYQDVIAYILSLNNISPSP